ncbi:pseudouridine synthase [Craterilacuibacter sp.]|uniref:pseudouridine synthase n=1 Tax=Craterilacuibacter sp. TaxID=2870909 RepID=UPI003F2E2E4F
MLNILYRDERIIVIDKPSGLIVHRSVLDWHETRFALQLLRDQIGQHVWAVHRLDKGTSGVLVFALDKDAARHLSQAFEAQQMEKCYHAVVRGWPQPAGHIDHALSRRYDDAEKRHDPSKGEPQAAQTDYLRLATIELPVMIERYPVSRYALMQLTPHSGRRHQLRRHMKHIAHPIIGDSTFGKGVHNRYFAEHLGAARMLLHCSALTLPHPDDGRLLTLQAPFSGEFAHLVKRMGWQDSLGTGSIQPAALQSEP